MEEYMTFFFFFHRKVASETRKGTGLVLFSLTVGHKSLGGHKKVKKRELSVSNSSVPAGLGIKRDYYDLLQFLHFPENFKLSLIAGNSSAPSK